MDGLLSELSPTAFTEIKHCCAYYRWVKNLEDTKGQSEAVNGRRTDNSTVKRMKILKGQSEAVNRGVKLVNGILPLPLLLIGSLTATDIHSC